MRRSALLFTSLALSLLVASCGGPVSSGPSDAGRPIGAGCTSDGDCESGACLSGTNVCTAPCTADSDCTSTSGGRALVCGVTSCASSGSGCAMCVPPCGSGPYTCVGAVSTACALVDDPTHCIDCGCADATTHCARDLGCLPPAAVGEPCALNNDCATNNCSTFAGVCRVAVGTACTAEDCDACLHLPGGTTHCSRECRGDSDCRTDRCLGNTTLGVLECLPTACTGTACTVERAVHETGQTCRADADCRSGACFASMRCSGSDCVADGWCAEPCGAASACPEDTHCVTIACATGQTAACGDVCLHACAEFVDCGVYGGTCSALQTPERTLEYVCDVRRDAGRNCLDDRECLSASCVSGTCAP